MIINIFATNFSYIFLAIPAGASVPQQFVPAGDETIQPFKRSVSLVGIPRLGINSSQVMQQMEEQGWAVIYAGFAAF